MFKREDLIDAYTRRQAIKDGVLIDVSETAREAGFVLPVAVTAGVWSKCVRVPEGVTGQDEAARLWIVLMSFRFALEKASDGGLGDFAVHVINFAVPVRNDDTDGKPTVVPVYVVCGLCDDGGPVVTVMLQGED